MNDIDLLAKNREEEIYQKIKKRWGDLSNIHPTVLEFELWKGMFDYIPESELQEVRKKIRYKEFLRSPYWRVVENYVRHTRKVCDYCRAEDGLKVYHRTLEHIGFEILFMDDLDYLCRKCRADNMKYRRKKKKKTPEEELFKVMTDLIKKHDKKT